jgi:hypothetical protein
MQIEYLTDEQKISWGTVFQYDTRDNLVSNSNIDSWTTYPYPNVDYGQGSNDLGFISPLEGASAVILDVDVSDESEYTSSNVRVKVRPQASAGGTIDPLTGTNIMSHEIEAVNLKGFQRSPSHKQVQVIVPLNRNGTFDYSYEVTGELPLLRHIKIVGKISEFDVESLSQGTKISQLPFTEAEVDDLFVVSRCEDDTTTRKFLTASEGSNKIPDFSEGTRNYNASYGVSLYHLKQGLGMGAYCTIVKGDKGIIDLSKSCFVNCHLAIHPGKQGAGTYQIITTNGLYKEENKVTVIASSSSGSDNVLKEGGFLSVGAIEMEKNNEPDTLPKIQGAKVTDSWNAVVEITQYKPSFKLVTLQIPHDDKKDKSPHTVYGPPSDPTPLQYCPTVLYVSFFGQ